MINIYLVCILITLHFIFDWILQPREVAKNKGRKNIHDLFKHLVLNIFPLNVSAGVVLYYFGFNIDQISIFFCINYISHGIIDYLLPKGKTERSIINWTAVDQILHLVILLMSTKII